jgi:hypothetical protein
VYVDRHLTGLELACMVGQSCGAAGAVDTSNIYLVEGRPLPSLASLASLASLDALYTAGSIVM